MEGLGERIRGVRKQLGLTLQALADDLRVSKSHLSGLENGKVSASDMLLQAICQRGSVMEHWLRTGEGPREALPDGVPPIALDFGTAATAVWSRRPDKRPVMVVDVGAGTTDVALLQVQPGDQAAKQQHYVVPGEDPRLTELLQFVVEFWATADDESRTWLRAHLRRTVPEFDAWLKKQPRS